MTLPCDFNAFILAAGEGRRLRPYTDNIPKPLVQLDGKPILEHMINRLKEAHIPHVTVNGHYKKEVLKTFLQDITFPQIYFSEENKLYNTGLGVKRALHTMEGKPFYLLNGDAFWTEGEKGTVLERLAAAWNPDTMDILLLLQPIRNMILTTGVGDYHLAEDGTATRSTDQSGEYMFAGIRICSHHIFENTPDTPFSFLDLMDAAEKKGRLHAIVHDANWHHISTPADLDRVNNALAEKAA